MDIRAVILPSVCLETFSLEEIIEQVVSVNGVTHISFSSLDGQSEWIDVADDKPEVIYKKDNSFSIKNYADVCLSHDENYFPKLLREAPHYRDLEFKKKKKRF